MDEIITTPDVMIILFLSNNVRPLDEYIYIYHLGKIAAIIIKSLCLEYYNKVSLTLHHLGLNL